ERAGEDAADAGGRRGGQRARLPGRGRRVPHGQLAAPAEDPRRGPRGPDPVRGRPHVLGRAAHQADPGLAHLPGGARDGGRDRDAPQGADAEPRREGPAQPAVRPGGVRGRGAAGPAAAAPRGGRRRRRRAPGAPRRPGGAEGHPEAHPAGEGGPLPLPVPPRVGPDLQGRLPGLALCPAGQRLLVPLHQQGLEPGPGLAAALLPHHLGRPAPRPRAEAAGHQRRPQAGGAPGPDPPPRRRRRRRRRGGGRGGGGRALLPPLFLVVVVGGGGQQVVGAAASAREQRWKGKKKRCSLAFWVADGWLSRCTPLEESRGG
ncbi:unnamed protein product, partial [Heterosigma akashiwo]